MPEVTPQDSMQQVARQINEIHALLFNHPLVKRLEAERAARPVQVTHTYFGPQVVPSRTSIFR